MPASVGDLLMPILLTLLRHDDLPSVLAAESGRSTLPGQGLSARPFL